MNIRTVINPGRGRPTPARLTLTLSILILLTTTPVATSQSWPDSAGSDFTFPAGPYTQFFHSDPAAYFILHRSPNLIVADEVPIAMKLGGVGIDQLQDTSFLASDKAFYRVQRVPLSTPLDTDGDGDNDLYELARPGFFDPLNPDDPFRHPNPNNPTLATGSQNPAAMAAAWTHGVHPHSGEATCTVTDLRVKGRVMDIAWTRTYRSQHGPDTAQGNGWDFSYNLFLEEHGADLVLHGGNARSDHFSPDGFGNWVRPEFFLTIVENIGGDFTLTYPDTGKRHFNAFAHPNAPGKITAIEDRNGNAITFNYDPSGRLQGFNDDLGRPYTVIYNPSGHISSLNDFTGRSVTFDYYSDPDPLGADGDLKSATTPTVTGTVTANDFPTGKTTTYTYSIGSPDENLNHNLLTITDPKSQVWMTYEYDPTADPFVLEYNRVTRQIWGDPGDIIDFTYALVAPNFGNNFATTKTIINDRKGHVKSLYFDDHTYGTRIEEFTGLAVPNLPTDDSNNLPAGPLRPSDPPLYISTWTYDTDGLVTLFTEPNQNSTAYTYDPLNPDPRLRGNLLTIQRNPGPLGGDQPFLTETFEYDPGFGGCCGSAFVTKHTDPRGNETNHTYDANGNRLKTTHRLPALVDDYTYTPFGQLETHTLPDNGSGHRRVDHYNYYGPGDGAQNGYLKDLIVDFGGFALTTTREYDARGNIVLLTDPKGQNIDILRNALDQPIRILDKEVNTTSGPVRYERLIIYDENDNIVRTDTENRDGDGTLNPNNHFTDLFDYDTLNNPIRVTQERDAGNNVVTEFEYDANENKTITRHGEATNGSQPNNTFGEVYDERDLVFQRVRAAGDPDQSTNQIDYDGNRNVVSDPQGLEDTPREHLWTYDGYDRPTSTTDPMGNSGNYTYDPNGNLELRIIEGETTDIAGNAGNIRLDERFILWDPLDRAEQQNKLFFDLTTQLPLGDGSQQSNAVYIYDSRYQGLQTDTSGDRILTYDTANRLNSITDGKGNVRTYLYDSNSNVVQTDETDKSDAGNPDQDFTTTRTYDALDRIITETDNSGNSTTRTYDSRDNVVRTTDGRDNVTFHTYDGLNRPITTTRVLTDTGTGAGVVTGNITTQRLWDDSSRLVQTTDDNGHSTFYTYDSLNRRTVTTRADGTSEVYIYDPHDNIVESTDANGTNVVHDYDLLNRLIQDTVLIHGAGVDPSHAASTFEYDGLSRLVTAADEDSTVTRLYDSLSNCIEEDLNGQTTSSTYGDNNRPAQTIYPGGRTIDRSYDSLHRLKIVDEGPNTLAAYDYIGQRRESFELGNGTRAEFTYDGISGIANPAGDFGTKRTIRTFHTVIAGGAIIEDRRYRWDRSQNKRTRRDHPGPPATRFEHSYAYDSASRLTRTIAEDGAALLYRDEQYDLDGLGNRNAVVGGNLPGAYTQDPTLPNPGDAQVNQYTATSFDTRGYDNNGNLVAYHPGQPFVRNLTYDYRNRLVQLDDAGTGQSHKYAYDAISRRISRTVDSAGAGPGPLTTRYFYDNARVIEEQDGAGTTTATYVGGQTGEEITMQRAGIDFYYHCDDLGNVMALTDNTAAVVEAYDYGDFGQILDPLTLNPLVGNPSAIGNPLFFGSGRYDAEAALYYTGGGHHLDPLAGRLTTRDIHGISYPWPNATANRPWNELLEGQDTDGLFMPKPYPPLQLTGGMDTDGLFLPPPGPPLVMPEYPVYPLLPPPIGPGMPLPLPPDPLLPPLPPLPPLPLPTQPMPPLPILPQPGLPLPLPPQPTLPLPLPPQPDPSDFWNHPILPPGGIYIDPGSLPPVDPLLIDFTVSYMQRPRHLGPIRDFRPMHGGFDYTTTPTTLVPIFEEIADSMPVLLVK